MSDLNMNFEKLDKVCKQANEEWKKMMEENNTFDTISKTAKDIADRKDREKALEFAKCIGNLFRENGVTAMIEEYRTGGTLKDKNLIEEYYGVAITGLDFTEHDKVFEDRIVELENIINHKLGDWDEHGIPYKEIFDMKAENQELKQRIAELESKETEKPTKINLNEIVKVKLTPYGAEIYYKQFDEVNKQYGKEICKPHMPRIDKDGYTEFQLWHFIELYGQHIGMCKQNVIEPLDIVYCKHNKGDEE